MSTILAETTASTSLIEAAGTGLTTAIDWVGKVLTAITSGALNPLLPMLGIGIGISALKLGSGFVRSFAWGA